jgi:LacI family transcriptional regulator
VSEQTAQGVRQVARQLGYRPNLAARALRLERAGTLLLVVPVLSNPFFGHVHMSVARAANEHGIGVVLCPLEAEDGSGLLPVPRQVLDGLITCSVDVAPGLDVLNVQAVGGGTPGVPWVALDATPGTADTVITMDVGDGMRQAVRHLISLGHRRIGYVGTHRATWTLTTRRDAVRAEVGNHPEVRLVEVQASFVPADVKQRVADLLRGPDRPTALLCTDDTYAFAAYGAARDLGLEIPADLSVVGCNDQPTAQVLTPALTTIRLPAEELGRLGVKAMLDGWSDQAPLPTALVVRASTAAAP